MTTTDPAAEGTVRWLTAAEQSAWRGLQRMQAHLAGMLSRDLSARSGLSLPDYTVLVVLSEQPDGRMRSFELGRELGWEKSRLSHHVARMANRGLLRREKCPSDQRGLFISLTPLGRTELEQAAPGHVEAVRQNFVDLLTPLQLRSLSEIAERVVESLDEQCRKETEGSLA